MQCWALRLNHLYRIFDFCDTFSQLPIPGQFSPHSLYHTTHLSGSFDMELPAYLLQIVPSKQSQKIWRYLSSSGKIDSPRLPLFIT